MIADSRAAYKTKEILTTEQFIKVVTNRYSNEED